MPRVARPLGWVVWLAGALIALGAGLALGLVITEAALRHGEEVGSVAIGSWRLHPQEGTPAINPYQRAAFARSGTVPISAGQGVALTAVRDAAGHKLDRHCSYAVTGPVPRARFWTLGTADPDGFALEPSAERRTYSSADVLRDEAGAFSVAVSPHPHPGNWLPLAGDGRFVLVLRLYDSVIPGLGSRELAKLAVPAIVAGPCR